MATAILNRASSVLSTVDGQDKFWTLAENASKAVVYFLQSQGMAVSQSLQNIPNLAGLGGAYVNFFNFVNDIKALSHWNFKWLKHGASEVITGVLETASRVAMTVANIVFPLDLLRNRKIINLKDTPWLDKIMGNILPIMFGCLFVQQVNGYIHGKVKAIQVINSGLTFAGHTLARIGVPLPISLGVKLIAATLDIALYRPPVTA
jgi:hypothetical protein